MQKGKIMEFSAVSTLRSITKLPFLLLLAPYTIHTMEEENTSTHDQQKIFSNPLLIKAIAKFNAHDQRKKDFARYIAPRSLHHDLSGNVHAVDVLNISIKTDKYSPMYRVDIAPVAISLSTNQMKLSCTTFNEYDPTQSVTVEMMLPLNESKQFDIPLGLIDETGQQVSLVIETTTQE
jgi:hypothetical protein